MKVASKFGTISEKDCLKAIDLFLSETIKSGFTEVSRCMFNKDPQAMLNAVSKHVNTINTLGLTRLSCVLNNQANCIQITQGNQLLYVQYCRILNIELQKTRDEFKQISNLSN